MTHPTLTSAANSRSLNTSSVLARPTISTQSVSAESVSWEDAAHAIENAAGKAAPTRLDAPQDSVRVVVEPTISLGGWVGWHRYLWEPQLIDAAKTAGVELTMQQVDDHWWYGTTYKLIVEGPQEAVDRFESWYHRRLGLAS